MREFAEPDYPRAITTPTLVIASGADRVVDTRAIERFATRLRAGDLIVIDGARHEIMMERDAYRELVFQGFRRFCARRASGAAAFTLPLRRGDVRFARIRALRDPCPLRRRPSRPTLSVIVPTYREAANVPRLFERLKAALDGLPWEMVVVDDDSLRRHLRRRLRHRAPTIRGCAACAASTAPASPAP